MFQIPDILLVIGSFNSYESGFLNNIVLLKRAM